MNVVARIALLLTLVVVPAVVYATSAGLPARVATHFIAGGAANGFMPRDAYVTFILGFSTLLPAALVALLAFVPQAAVAFIKVPLRAHWLAPGRRPATMAWARAHACWFGVLLALFLLGVHLLTVQANTLTPPRLAEPTMFVLLGGFLAGLALWVATGTRHFRRAP